MTQDASRLHWLELCCGLLSCCWKKLAAVKQKMNWCCRLLQNAVVTFRVQVLFDPLQNSHFTTRSRGLSFSLSQILNKWIQHCFCSSRYHNVPLSSVSHLLSFIIFPFYWTGSDMAFSLRLCWHWEEFYHLMKLAVVPQTTHPDVLVVHWGLLLFFFFWFDPVSAVLGGNSWHSWKNCFLIL